MRRALLLIGFSLAAGCATEDQDPPVYGDGLGTPENPIPQDSVPYTVHTQVEPTGTALPAQVASITAALRQFATAPTHQLLTAAAQAAPSELAALNTLPSAVRSRLEAWMDAEIDKVAVDGMHARQIATDVAGFAETALTRFGFDSTLSFTPTTTSHTLAAITFRLDGFDVVVPVGGMTADKIDQHVAVTIGDAGAVTFGNQSFGVAFGAHAWHGVNLAATSELGTDASSALASAVNCRVVAQAVALKCYNGACVGHAAELSSLCEQSLAAVSGALATQINSFDIASIHLPSGTAKLIDDNGDGLANRIENGAWSLDATLGNHASFTASAPGR